MKTVYIMKHKKEEVRMKSRSGGIFTALSDWVLEQNGVVYGCMLNDKFEAIHERAETKLQRDKFCGSKYVQSRMGNILKQVEKDLKDSRIVLFSGTACQIAGLKAYLLYKKIQIEHIFFIDIICHGVPSPMVWNDYLRYMERKYHGNIKAVDFRNKWKYGWKEHIETIWIQDKEYNHRIYTKLFCDHNILRESCYYCPYKSLERIADITIGDAWGIHIADADFDDNKGVSLILVISKKGEKLLNEVKPHCDMLECKIENYMQPALKHPFKRPEKREQFWDDYNKLSFEKIVQKYGKSSWKTKIKKVKKYIPFKYLIHNYQKRKGKRSE